MKKIGIYYFVIIGILITVFNKFDEMKLLPLTTPEEYLGSQPFITIGERIMTQPSSTLIVYLLGVFIIALGVKFLRNQENQESRKWWGISMIFWGIGTILAGTSYQAFGYEIKAVGYEYTNFTCWWEVAYLLFTGISIGFMIIGMSYCITSGKTRKVMQKVAIYTMYIYGLVLLVGSLLPVQLLVTYELFNLFFMPHFIVFFIINIKNYKRDKDTFNKRFIHAWILFIAVNASYYIYYWFGFSEILLRSTGIWFNQNDVLHVMVFVWMAYIWVFLTKTMYDK